MDAQKARKKSTYLPADFQGMNERQKKEVAVINMWLSPKSKTTRKNYLYLYESLKSYVPGLSIWELDTVHFSAFFTKISVGKTKRTMALYRSIFMSLMEYAVKLGLASSNPILKTTEYKYTRNLRSRVLVEEDVLKLIEKTEGRNRAILMLLYHTGMRVSELAQLKWSHFFYEPEKVRIEVLGKGDKVRHIFLRYSVFHEIRSLLIEKVQDESCNYLVVSSQMGPYQEKFVVEKKEGGGLTRRALWEVVQKESKRILGKGISPHMLRHSHASVSISKGAPIHVLQNTLGHSSLSTTQVYLHVVGNESSSDWL